MFVQAAVSSSGSMLAVSDRTWLVCGLLLLTVVGIVSGGLFLLKVGAGDIPANGLQKAFYRAGHAHAGVLVTLSLVTLVIVDLANVAAWSHYLTLGIPLAAVLISAGFFLSVQGKDPQHPNGLRSLIIAGAISLAIGVIAAGVGLILVAFK